MTKPVNSPGSSGAPMPGGRRYDSLLLRPWAESDAVELRRAIDEGIGHLKPWLSWTLEEPATLETTRDRIVGWVAQHTDGRAFRYAISPLEQPWLILGGVHLNCRVGPAAHDIGYWVSRSAARQGIATAVVSKVAVFTFTERDIRRLIIQCDVANDRSAALARALGFDFAGTTVLAYADGSPRPVLQFEMSVDQYRTRHAPVLVERAGRVRLVAGIGRPFSGSE